MSVLGARAGLASLVVATLLLICPPAQAESPATDFSAATNDATLITPEAGGGYDATLKSDGRDIGREASASGVGPGGGGGSPAGKRDDGFGCSCDVRGGGHGGAAVLFLGLLLLARRRL